MSDLGGSSASFFRAVSKQSRADTGAVRAEAAASSQHSRLTRMLRRSIDNDLVPGLTVSRLKQELGHTACRQAHSRWTGKICRAEIPQACRQGQRH